MPDCENFLIELRSSFILQFHKYHEEISNCLGIIEPTFPCL